MLFVTLFLYFFLVLLVVFFFGFFFLVFGNMLTKISCLNNHVYVVIIFNAFVSV